MNTLTPTARRAPRTRLVAVLKSPSRAARNRRQRAAAVALAVGFALTAAAQLGSGWAIQTDRVPLRDPQYLDKLELLRAHEVSRGDPAQTTVVFLGSSRTLDAIDAGAAGPALASELGRPVAAFNFAHAGAGPVTNAVYMRRLLADGVRPDVVVIEVLPPFLAAQVDPPPEARWLLPARLRPDELPLVRRLGIPARTPGAHGPRGWLVPWHEYRQMMIDRYTPALASHRFPMGVDHGTDRHGYIRVREIGPAERARLLELTRRQYADFMPGYTPGGCGVAGLRELLETCRAAGVRAALVFTPESSEFRAWYPVPGRSRVGPVVAELAREFGVPLFDGREWVPDGLIGDGHHTTGAGADLFTHRLVREALAPWLKGGAP